MYVRIIICDHNVAYNVRSIRGKILKKKIKNQDPYNFNGCCLCMYESYILKKQKKNKRTFYTIYLRINFKLG